MYSLDYVLDKYNARGKKMPVELLCTREYTLVKLFKKLKFSVGAEIGVARGHFSARICHVNPQIKLYCVDAWKAHYGCPKRQTDATFQRFYKTAKWRLAPYNCKFIRKWSKDAVKQFKDNSLDFVYIDASHDHKSVTNDIKMWSKKVRPGGIVSGHDYTDPIANKKLGYYKEIYDVKAAVNDWVKTKKINNLFILIKRDSSWFYVK